MTEPREPGVPADRAAPAAPASAGPDAPNAGRIVDGRYRLAEVIGTGGMATVHRALDTRLGRFVAVKLLRREVIQDADIAMRFRREALAATVLRHRNIVACLETGTDDGQPYLVMELIEGEDLAARLRRGGRLAAARRGPDRPRRRAGARRRPRPRHRPSRREARQHPARRATAARWSPISGSPASPPTPRARPGHDLASVHYFSPEQAKGATTTPASDIYSLGLVLFEALTGQRAWSGDTTAQLAAARIDSPGALAPQPCARTCRLPSTRSSFVRSTPIRRAAIPNGNAMADALESFVPAPRSRQRDRRDRQRDASCRATGAGASAGHRAIAGSIAAPLHPPGAVPAPGRSAGRRASPVIAGPLAVLLVVAVVVVGALLVAALPGGDTGDLAVATTTPAPTRTPAATARPTATVRPTPRAHPAPTAAPRRAADHRQASRRHG